MRKFSLACEGSISRLEKRFPEAPITALVSICMREDPSRSELFFEPRQFDRLVTQIVKAGEDFWIGFAAARGDFHDPNDRAASRFVARFIQAGGHLPLPAADTEPAGPAPPASSLRAGLVRKACRALSSVFS